MGADPGRAALSWCTYMLFASLSAAALSSFYSSAAPACSHRGARVRRLRCTASFDDVDQLINQNSPVNLAYIGDAVWELEVRKRLLWPPRRINDLNADVVSRTCAEGQCAPQRG
jgi:hypothetical protein